MFKFVKLDTKQNENYDKGVLFEQFSKKVLESSGYIDIELRRKHKGLEYDFIARHGLDKTEIIIGEAKAHQRNIEAPKITSFVGKMLLHWQKNNNTLGLFISLSNFTAEAQEYIESIKQKNRLVTIVGEDLIKLLAKNTNCLTFNLIKRKAKNETKLKVGDTYFCITDRGNYFIQLLIPIKETMPRYFAIYTDEGIQINDFEFENQIKQNIDELQNISIYNTTSILENKDKSMVEILKWTRGSTVEYGQEWFDYKLPASPEFFIGREIKISEYLNLISDYINKKSNISIIQILSKSGVGKSSFLLKAKSITDNQEYISVIVDARDIKNSLDILAITQQYVKEFNKSLKLNFKLPLTQVEIAKFFINANKILNKLNRFSIIYLDQFEGLYSRPSIFEEIFSFFYEIIRNFNCFLLVIGRKSDYLTTLDDSKFIDYDRLYNSSKHINLPDFNKDEALELLKKLESIFKKPVKRKLIDQVLELSNGFPWLHKRICYHIYKLHQEGSTQDNIIESGLRIEELFDEELENLDELDKEFLKNLVNYLPSSIYELIEKIKDYPDFLLRLRKLKNLRLIRLTGNTFDTYNDFFKEYIKTGRIPIKTSYILRQFPKSIEKWINLIIENKYQSINVILTNVNIKRGTIHNIFRDIRILGLIDYRKGDIIVKPDVLVAHSENTLPQLIKTRLFDNTLVIDTITHLSNKKELKITEITEILRSNFHFIEASMKTWETYAKKLISWLIYCKFDDDIQLNLKTQTISRRSRKSKATDFFPQNFISGSLKALKKIVENSGKINKIKLLEIKGYDRIVRDLNIIGFIDSKNEDIYITQKGQSFYNSSEHIKREIIAEILLSWKNIENYLQLLKFNQRISSLEIFKDYVIKLGYSVRWSEFTTDFNYRLLKSWLIYSNLVVKAKKRGEIKHIESIVSLKQFFQVK